LGKYLKKHLNLKKVLLADDSRESSNWIKIILSSGLNSYNKIDVHDSGIITTPSLAKIISLSDYDAGIMISASHNPANFNGIKIINNNGKKIDDTTENKIEKDILKGNKSKLKFDIHKKIDKKNYREIYKNFLMSEFKNKLSRDKKIIFDCSNGAASFIAGDIFLDLGLNSILINNNPNGKNINKKCGALYPKQLAKQVVKKNADLGFAFDGDGDRVIAVDEKGRILDGDYLIYILAKDYFENGYRKPVVGTIMSNLSLQKKIEKLGLDFLRTPVGDKYVWDKMLNTNSLVGGETSGHIILRDYHNTGDGILTALKIIEILTIKGKRLSEYKDELTLYPQIMINMRVNKKLPLKNIQEITEFKKNIKRKYKDKVRTIIRYSGTEPLLRIMVEGENKKELENLLENFVNKLDNYFME